MTSNNAPPTAILVDDEAAVLAHTKRLLTEVWPELRILDTAQNGREAIAKIGEQVPDIVFLDIKMPGKSGLDVARELNTDTLLVFVTAFDEFAVQAFEQAATDYLLKPATPERLAETVARLKEKLANKQSVRPDTLNQLLEKLGEANLGGTGQPAKDWLKWLRVGHGDEVELVATGDVVYLQSDHKYTSVFTAHSEYVLRAPLAELEQQLDPSQFWRIHRGIIVAVKEIKSARRDLRGRYTLSLRSRPEAVRSSAAYKHLFAQM